MTSRIAANWNKLHLAIVQEKFDTVSTILTEHQSAVNSPTRSGNTPLHLAVLDENVELVRLLIKLGANVHAENAMGETPLHFAVQTNSAKAVALLFQAGANLNAEDFEGLTPIEWAAEAEHEYIFSILLSFGANPPRAVDSSDDEDIDERDNSFESPSKTSHFLW
eukprot:TRINITY_DN284_c0_g1_i1.p1 TRINITY_DN284_c0_g1~~TRINITY_DN284_c0_g1_i1.p1  ORF type:complete len:187 (-),score=103.16 TRINITY_DN284_c0_g1_i1:140-634(-)